MNIPVKSVDWELLSSVTNHHKKNASGLVDSKIQERHVNKIVKLLHYAVKMTANLPLRFRRLHAKPNRVHLLGFATMTPKGVTL